MELIPNYIYIEVDFLPEGFDDYKVLENDETMAVIEGRENVKRLYEMLEN